MKMDKREIIFCLLFACFFITMIFIRAFAADAADPGTTLPVHGKQSALDILADDTSYNTWLDNLRAAGADVASNVWSTASDMAKNLLAYGVGCVANVTEEVLQVAFPDLEHYLGDMYFDWDSLQWEFTVPDDVEDFIKSGLEPYAYSYPDPGTVGYWQLAPDSGATVYWQNSSGNRAYIQHSSGGSCYVATINRGSSNAMRIYSSADPNGLIKISQWGSTTNFGDWYSLNQTYTLDGVTYYYFSTYDSTTQISMPGSYSSTSSALADLWGSIEPEDPVLTGDVIYFDDPQFEPLGYYPSTALDFTSIVNEGHTNNYDYSVVNIYNTYYPSTFTFDIPYWLYVPSTTPKIYDLPSDYDFGNIQFDFEADVSFLDGAGVIQDVYDILPSKLQNLIILFGAGTCAFIFLRR